MRRSVEKSHREVVTYSFTAREVLAALEGEHGMCLTADDHPDYERRRFAGTLVLRSLAVGLPPAVLSLEPGDEVLAVDLVFDAVDADDPPASSVVPAPGVA